MSLKSKVHITVVTSILLFSSLPVISQHQPPEIAEDIIEQIARQSKEPLDYTCILDDLYQLSQNPLNINKATRKDLEKLYILTGSQIEELISYRNKTETIYTLYELQLIDGFSYELIQKLKPFITLTTKTSGYYRTSPSKKAKHQLLLRSQRTLQKEEGFINYQQLKYTDIKKYNQKMNSRFLGTPWKHYYRYTFSSANKKLTLGMTAEKDAGEPFFKTPANRGFDFYSYHLQWKGQGLITQVNLGDYQLGYGQGLCLWSGLTQSKSVYTVHHAKKSQGTRPYRSADENRFFRGASILWNPIKNIEIMTFLSHKKRDAHIAIQDNPLSPPTHATSLPSSGLHRNNNEIAQRHTLKESVWGSNIQWSPKNFQTGITFLRYHYNPALIPSNQTYRIHNFSGENNFNIGTHYQFHYHHLHFFGEMAISHSGGKAILQGIQAQPHSRMEFEILYRHYDPDYQALYANSFSEQSSPKNEEGFYIGAILHPFSKWKLSAYYDLYKFPWLRYRANAPGNGHDMFAQIDYQHSSKANMYIRFKREQTTTNQPQDIGIPSKETATKQQFRFHINYHISTQWQLRNRFEMSTYKLTHTKEEGYLLYQDIIYKHQSTKLSASFRFALFDTDSYQSRIYAYENDVLYAFSIPPYFHKGTRYYITVRYPIYKKADLYLRYAQTKYNNKSTISSGTSLIKGNTKSEIKVLLRIAI